MMGSSLCSSISSGSEGESVGVYTYMCILDMLHVAIDFVGLVLVVWVLVLAHELSK